MQEFIRFGFSGLTSGAIFAIAASGLVLTYTTTGVFNFAHGAMGMVAAFTYWEMRFGWHWPAPIALFVCLLILAPLFGALLELAIMRRLEGTSETTKLVVTISILLALLGLALWVWDPLKGRPIRDFWQGSHITLLSTRLTYHEVTVLVTAALVAIGLRMLLFRTRVGVAMRAVVDDRSLARLNGARPGQTAMLSWAIGVGLAALAGILISPATQLSAQTLTLLIIDAYAAAMIGRLRSLPMTFAGAIFLGLANDYARGYLTGVSWFERYGSGLLAAVPIVILFVVLVLLPQARLRGHRAQRTREIARMPTWPGTSAFCGVIIAGTAMLSTVIGRADLFSVTRIWGIGIIALSMIPLIGYAGQISLCQLTFAGIGMVVVAHLGAQGNPLALLWAALITGFIGAIVALPALRLRGIYLALSTAAFAVLVDRWFYTLPRFTMFGHRFDLFQSGSLTVNKPRFFGLSLENPKTYFVFGAIAFSLVALLVVAVRRSTFGQRLLALKDSPAAYATLGLNPRLTTLAVFSLSAAMAAVGGAVYGAAPSVHAVAAQGIDFFAGLPILMLMVIGGLNSLGGALFCGIFLGAPIISNVFPSLRQLQTVVVGVAGVGLGKNPNGFIVNDIRPQWDVLLKEPVMIVAAVAAEMAAWALNVLDVVDNWTYVFLALGSLIATPYVAAAVHRRRRAAAEPAAAGDGLSGPLEWLGVTQPFVPEDVVVMDRVLALPVVGSDGAP